MNEIINLKGIFLSKVRNELYNQLIKGPLKGWNYVVVTNLIDEAIEKNRKHIDYYLQQKDVTLMNTNEHVRPIIDEYLIPYLEKKKVR